MCTSLGLKEWVVSGLHPVINLRRVTSLYEFPGVRSTTRITAESPYRLSGYVETIPAGKTNPDGFLGTGYKVAWRSAVETQAARYGSWPWGFHERIPGSPLDQTVSLKTSRPYRRPARFESLRKDALEAHAPDIGYACAMQYPCTGHFIDSRLRRFFVTKTQF
jgi:hypothetical protein